MCVLIYDFFSLSVSVHSMRQSIGPTVSLQGAAVCSVLRLSNAALYIRTTFFTHSSTDEHVGAFCVLAIVNSAAHWCARAFELRFSAGRCPRGRLRDHKVIVFLVFKGKLAVPIYIPP